MSPQSAIQEVRLSGWSVAVGVVSVTPSLLELLLRAGPSYPILMIFITLRFFTTPLALSAIVLGGLGIWRGRKADAPRRFVTWLGLCGIALGVLALLQNTLMQTFVR